MTDETTWARSFAVWLYDYRQAVFIGALLLTGLAVVPALQVGVDTSVQHWFTEGDPALESYRDFQRTYGNDEVVLIALRRSDGILTAEGFSLLAKATDRVRKIDGVASVRSLATQARVQMSFAGPQLVPLLGTDSLSATKAQALRAHVRSDSTYDRLVSADGTMAAVYARMERNAKIDGRRNAILDSIQHALAPLDVSVHLAGTGVILDALNDAATQDAFLFTLAASVLIFLLLWMYFRRVGPVLLTLGIVGAATTWLMGIYGLSGKDVNMVTVVMPTLVMVVCTADCVHLLIYASDLPDSLTPRQRTVRTLGDLAPPCLVTTLTTAAGFASLASSSMALVRTLGIFCAIGVGAGLITAFAGCAVALPYDAALPDRSSQSWLRRTVNRVVDFGLQRWRIVIMGAMGVAVGAAVGLGGIQADTNPIGYLFPDHRVRQDSNLIERTLGSYAPLEFVVRADSGATDPALLRAIEGWQAQAVRSGVVDWHYSPVDELRRLHAVLPDGGATVPDNPNRLEGLLRLGSRELPYLSDLQAHPDQLRVTFGVPIQSANGIEQALDSLQALAQLPTHATLEPTGYLPLYVRIMNLLTDSLVRSFGLALLVISGMIALLFRSGRMALLSLVPNGLPILLALGLMGWLSIPLDAATMTIAAVVFGLVVDDTIHVFRHYVVARTSQPPVPAIRESAHHTGRRMAITTSVIAAGFLVLCVTQMQSIFWVGVLSAFAIVVALAADLLVLPAVIAGLYGSAEAPAS